MSEFNFTFSVLGEKQVSQRFLDLIADVSDMREPFEDVADEFLESEDATFQAEGAFEGKQKWQALDEKYSARKRSKFGSMSLLVASGALRSALTEKGADGNIRRVNKQTLEMGVNLPVNGWNLGIIHQLGRKDGTLPPREVLRITEDQKKRWVNIFRTYIYQIEKAMEDEFKQEMLSAGGFA